MYREEITKHEAILKALDFIGNPNLPQPRPIPKPKPESTPEEKAIFLNKMFTYFKNAVYNSKPAQEYIQSRKLDFTKLEIGYNSGQFHHAGRTKATGDPESVPGSSKKDETLIKQCLQHGLLIDNNTKARTGEPAYNVFGKSCIVFALKNKQNQVTGLYFRSTSLTPTLSKGEGVARHFYLKNRSGLYPGYPKPETKRLILTEAIIDAASLLHLKNQEPRIKSQDIEILSLYGTNGFTEEHAQAIVALKELQEIILFFDGDKAGREAITHVTERLNQLSIDNNQLTISFVETPENEDINSLWQGHPDESGQAPAELFINLIENRKEFFFSIEKTNEIPFEKKSSQDEAPAIQAEQAHDHAPQLLDTTNPYNLNYHGLAARYYIKGGIRPQPDSMRVSLQIVAESSPFGGTERGLDYRTKLDV
jgi:5S rRNA maturation endonuclease (ribonuclease M5)